MEQYTTPDKQADQWLVKCHKNGRELQTQALTSAKVTVFADLMKVSVPDFNRPERRPRGDRTKITSFTKRSRKNMLEKLAKVRNPTGGLFCTITYPGEFLYSPSQVKDHLKRLRKRLLRRFPGAGVFWRMEIKTRLSGASEGQKVPHFHLLVFLREGAIPLVDFRAWLALTWWECVGSGDASHRLAGTQADLIMNRAHAQRYASKYAAKPDEELLENCQDLTIQSELSWGRHWGTFGEFDLTEAMTITVSLNQLHELRRMAAKLLKSKGRAYAKRLKRSNGNQGFTVFGLGDLSFDGWGHFTESTIMKMLLAL